MKITRKDSASTTKRTGRYSNPRNVIPINAIVIVPIIS